MLTVKRHPARVCCFIESKAHFIVEKQGFGYVPESNRRRLCWPLQQKSDMRKQHKGSGPAVELQSGERWAGSPEKV